MIGSLVRRVALVLSILVVFPLLLYMGFLWDRDYKVKLNAAFSEMQLVSNFSISFLNQWYHKSHKQLETLSVVSEEERERAANLLQHTILTFDETFTCTYATQKQLVGRKDLFPKILSKTAQVGSLLFIGKNPATNREELFLFLRKNSKIWVLGIDLENWMRVFSDLRNVGFPITISFYNLDSTLLFSTDPSQVEKREKDFIQWNLPELKQWKKKAGFFEGRKLRGKEIALDLSVPNADFDVQVSLTSEQIEDYVGGHFFFHILILLGLIILIGGAGAIWLIFRIAKPFRQLCCVMQAVHDEDYSQKYVEDRLGFEINDLGKNFNQMLAALLRNIEAAQKEKISRELLSKELEIGRNVQNRLLPEKTPEFSGLSMGKGFIPAKEVAGDFYDLFVRGENELLLVLADGSDKGVSACLYSLMVRSMLRSYAMAGESLENIVFHTNNLFARDTGDTGNFVTAFVGIYHANTHKLLYTSAGHLPAIFFDVDGNHQELTTEGIALGATEMDQIEVKSIQLSPGSFLFLYSDGITEAQNEKGELFGKSRLIEFLISHRLLTPQVLVDRLMNEVNQFAGETAQHDDLTAVCLKVH
ncbi:MAG: Phosphoserine phosphatase RsbU [Chlamydiae bacterium]|nr:Phosphoserine phosphatase RsbU [Chlamydiota bacterium]